MKNGAKWGIGLGVGIPAVLILIGLVGLIIKFFMKRCRKRAWDDITILPKHMDSAEDDTIFPRLPKRKASDRQPLYEPASNNAMEVSDTHIAIPIDEKDTPPGQHELEKAKKHEHTLVQIQRDRLNRLKEENRAKPIVHLNHGENDVQRAIDQAQKEFDESV
jgi:hypothetical protein